MTTPPSRRRAKLLVCLAVAALACPARAAINWTGDVDPSDPTTWTNSTTGVTGDTAYGTITVDDGSDLLSGIGYVSYSPDATGELTVSGSGSSWEVTHGLFVARNGSGTLNIQASGQVTSDGGFVGYLSGSTGDVAISGAGSLWNSTDYLSVGYYGSGSLSILAGGAVHGSSGYVGFKLGSTGQATVAGAGSHWNNTEALHVGFNGSGSLRVEDGGQVTAGTLYASLPDLLGDGSISATGGAVLDADLLFDAVQGNQNVLPFGSGGALTVAAEGGTLGAGYNGAGTLTIADGVFVDSFDGALGYHSGSNGVATVSGAGSQWKNVRMILGRDGAGTLNVHSGGNVSSGGSYLGHQPGSTGEATISGTGSQWTNSLELYVGDQGEGTLNILAGGTVTSRHGYLGNDSGSTGAATISGAGSKWTNDHDLYVGRKGGGTLHVDDGGHVSAGTLYASLTDLYGNGTIAATDGAILDGDMLFDATHGEQSVLSFGTGGTLTVTADIGSNLGAGYKGTGSLTIVDGVAIRTSHSYLGYMSGSTGEATVSGAGSQWRNDRFLYAGLSGDGTLNIREGGTVINLRGYLGHLSGSTGKATVSGSGSHWNNLSLLYVGDEGGGALSVRAGGTVRSNMSYLGSNNGSQGEATVTGTGSEWNNESDLFVGDNGAGTLTITHGGLVSVGGRLTIDGDLNGDSSINLSTGGMLALESDDTGDDSLADFLALIEGTDAIRYWDDALDDWAPITDATYGEDYTLEYQTTGGLIWHTLLTVGEYTPLLPGDFNNDGVVDASDYTLARDHLGDPDETAIGYNGDGGGIDESDLALWRSQYGSTLDVLTGEAVPEPAALPLLLAAAATLGKRRR